MTEKEEEKKKELMKYLHNNVFDPILNNPKVPNNIKSGVNLTIGRMNRLSSAKMVQYFWSALAQDNAIKFAEKLRDEHLPRFEDVFEEFRKKFNDSWIRS